MDYWSGRTFIHQRFIFDLFKGALALFLMEMGLIVAKQVGDLRRNGIVIIAFGITMPLIQRYSVWPVVFSSDYPPEGDYLAGRPGGKALPILRFRQRCV